MSIMSDLHLAIHQMHLRGAATEAIAEHLDVSVDWVLEALSMTMFVNMSDDTNE
jgi:hypothetical protein